MANTITKFSIAAGSALFATMAGFAPAQAALLNFTTTAAYGPTNTAFPVSFTLNTGVANSTPGGATNNYSGAITNFLYDNAAPIATADLTTSGLGNNATYTINIGGAQQLFINFANVPNGVNLANIGSLTGASSFSGATVVQATSSAPGTNVNVPLNLLQEKANNICFVAIGTTVLPTSGPIGQCAGVQAIVPAGPPTTTVPESNPATSLLALGALGAGATLLRKMKHKASLTTV